ncbi:MAG: hypothetical protein B7Y25_04235 [Alphaproteobacteria bacterium 16-39-46]|nr:MAG: hypothetical protein B7Y25_04235 [Alphaproteobacteria bacterium 16-39-46]OZA43073.1 MAG: hypothetical protein B7X84_04200 [Alphaproteobacteria bacterium 17-39-52]HQS84115.1 DedA family protein [Alphaproteobacteria bacterium]HQS93989.1 DedA family protein [Alphaproteobacteria bacterium]
MDAFLASIQDYGYWFLIFGALIEGESILLLAGAAAYMGYFSLPMVMTVSFIGAIIHDQLLYSIGKVGGTALLHRSKMFEKKSHRAFALLKKYDHWLIMGFRFVYGIRTITPVVIGASDISFKRYTFLTIISAAIWAIIVSSVGYFLADIIQSLIADFEGYKFYIIGTPILLIGLGIGIFYLIKHQRSKRKTPAHPKSSNTL